MNRIGYIRVSTNQQNTARQLDSIQLDKVFEEKESGVNKDRQQLKAMIDYVREGDVVYVHSIDRLGRSLIDLKNIVEQLKSKGVSIVFVKNNLEFSADKSNSTHELMFNILGSFAQFERELIKERQAEGIAKAKLEGVYKGKPRKVTDQEILDKLKDGFSIRKTAEILSCGISTVQRVKKAYE